MLSEQIVVARRLADRAQVQLQQFLTQSSIQGDSTVPRHPKKNCSASGKTVYQSQSQPRPPSQPCICIYSLVACSLALLQQPNSCNTLLPTTKAYLHESSSPPFAQALRTHPSNHHQPTPSTQRRLKASRTPPRPTRSPHLLRSTRKSVLGIQVLRGQANGGL